MKLGILHAERRAVRRSTGKGLCLAVALTTFGAVGVGLASAPASAAPSCGSACYVSASGGLDTNSGTISSPLQTIQAGIDAVNPGGTVFVRPGNYSETAPNVSPISIPGTYTFGLYLGKNSITVQGVHADNSVITSHTDPAMPDVKTNSTADFGADGVFVEGDHDTIAGLHIDENLPSNSCNKSIEVVGDAFTFKNGIVNDPCGGDIYIDDLRYNTGTQTPHVNSYTITGNEFGPGNTVDVGNGAGHGTAASTRLITNNVFDGEGYWPAISFNGADSGVAWFLYPVGGATITGNKFRANEDQYIRARGTYDTNTFNWSSYFTKNQFAGAAMNVTPTNGVRTYSYSFTGGSWNNVRRIGGRLQHPHKAGCAGADCNGEITNALPGDTVRMEGSFAEHLNLIKAVSLQGVHQMGQIAGAIMTGPNSGSGITVQSPGPLTIRGINVTGYPVSVAVLSGSAAPTIVRDGLRKVTNATATKVNASCSWWGSSSGPAGSQVVGPFKTHPFLHNNKILVASC